TYAPSNASSASIPTRTVSASGSACASRRATEPGNLPPMKRTLQGQRVLITGASSGIGRALAHEAAAAGMRGAITARSADKLNEIGAALRSAGHDIVAEPTDVTSPDDRRRLLDAVGKQFGGLDVLINNAGQGTQGLFVDSTEPLLRQIMEVNFF